MPGCNDCNKRFDTKRHLYKHVRLVQKKDPIPRNFECGHCHQIFTRLNNLVRHSRSFHKFSSNFQCRVCAQVFGSQSSLKNHNDFCHLKLGKKDVHSAPIRTPVLFFLESASVNSHFQIFRIDLAEDLVDPFAFLLDNKDHLKTFLVEKIQGQGHSRMGLCVQVQLMKTLNEQSVTPYFNSSLLRVVGIIDDDDWFETIEQVICQINIFCTGWSGWVVQKLINVDLKVCKGRSLYASSYNPTPPKMKKLKQSLLNIKNVNDDVCFLYCVAAALFPVTHNRCRSNKYSSRLPELIFDPSNLPMEIEHIPKFEHANNLSITVFHYREDGVLTTCYWGKRRENVWKKTNLVLLTNAETSH